MSKVGAIKLLLLLALLAFTSVWGSIVLLFGMDRFNLYKCLL